MCTGVYDLLFFFEPNDRPTVPPEKKTMFGIFKKKNQAEVLRKQYLQLMEEAMQIQRSGDIKSYALKVAEAEALQDEIARLEEQES